MADHQVRRLASASEAVVPFARRYTCAALCLQILILAVVAMQCVCQGGSFIAAFWPTRRLTAACAMQNERAFQKQLGVNQGCVSRSSACIGVLMCKRKQ